MKYLRELETLKNAILDAWQSFKNLPMNTRSKGAFDCVTDVDFNMERFISDRLRSQFPDDKIIGEEFSPEQGVPEGRAWVLDPIDGTVNMSHGIPLFGVQAVFFDGGAAAVSVIYLPNTDELYTAVRGEGAYLNGKPTRVADRPLDSAMVSVGDYSHKRDENAKTQIELVDRLYDKIGKLRHFGAASIDFTFVASGRSDGFFMFTKNLWDIFPGVLLVEEAGGIVVSTDGGAYDYRTSPGVAALATEELRALFSER